MLKPTKTNCIVNSVKKPAMQLGPEKKRHSISPARESESAEIPLVAVPLTIAQLMSNLASAPTEATAKLLAEALQRARWTLDTTALNNDPVQAENSQVGSTNITSPFVQNHEEVEYDGPKTPPIEDEYDDSEDQDQDQEQDQALYSSIQSETHEENNKINPYYEETANYQEQYYADSQEHQSSDRLETNNEEEYEPLGPVKHEDNQEYDGPRTPPYLPEDEEEEEFYHDPYMDHQDHLSTSPMSNCTFQGPSPSPERTDLENDQGYNKPLDTPAQQPVKPSDDNDDDMIAKWTIQHPKQTAVDHDTPVSWLDPPQLQGTSKESTISSIFTPSKIGLSSSPYTASFSKQIESFVDSCFERLPNDSPKSYPRYPDIDSIGIKSQTTTPSIGLQSRTPNIRITSDESSGPSSHQNTNNLDQSAVLLGPLSFSKSVSPAQESSKIPSAPRALLNSTEKASKADNLLKKQSVAGKVSKPTNPTLSVGKKNSDKRNTQLTTQKIREGLDPIPRNYPFFDPSLERGTICGK
ncbi:hypothetical protein CLU79DRAFT_176619 [Phycomyces nitens]|nr:hypothetical protein CLU79DRAFT_176619 [Phycomyces nitens]